MRTLFLASITAVGLGSSLVTAEPYDVTRPTDEVWTRGPNSCATPQVPAVAPDGFARVLLAPGAQRVVFLNRLGGMYNVTQAATDSGTNTVSSRITGRALMANIAPLGSNFDWPMIVTCVKNHFKDIDVRFVETQPAAGPFLEAVVGGSGAELGFGASSGILGIAAADNFCDVTETGICFSFSDAHGGSSRNAELCTTVSHEIGHLLALEHEVLATDLMSYVPVTSQPNKGFQNQASACGTYPQQPQNCSCSSSQQNSFNRLQTYVGPKPVESVAPSLSISSPSNGATVPPVFEVVATASDDMAMADVRVLVDGVEGGHAAVPVEGKYTVTVRDAALGDHQLMIIARDEAGNETTQTIAVKIAKAQIGDSCVANEACEGNLCATNADGNFCTQTCDVANDTCPSDFECQDLGGTSVCVVTGGCGCSTSSPRDAIGALLVLFVGLLVSRRKRR
ncbi:MAG: Ig-like domain-containing protein [Kofleriaceae bacterium]